MPQVNFAPWDVDEAKQINASECLNLFAASIKNQSALTAIALRAPAGVSTFVAASGANACRGMIVLKNQLYGIFGDRFYHIASNGVKTAIGDTVSGNGRLQLAQNGQTILVIEPNTTNGWFYNSNTNAFTQIADATFIDYGNKLDVTSLDGYFVVVTTQEFFWSSLVVDNDGQDWNGLDFSTASIKPDENTGCIAVRNELYIFGEYTTEVFQNTGSTAVWERVPGAAIDRGAISAQHILEYQNRYVAIGNGQNEGISIWVGGSGQATRISTDAVDNVLQSVPRDDLANTFLLKYSETGDYFVAMTIPNNITLVWNETNQSFHRRTSGQSAIGTWRVNHIEQVYGDIIVGDAIDDRLGVINLSVFTEYGELLRRRFSTYYAHKSGQRFRIPRCELHAQLGITGIAQIDPIPADMSISVDGGNIYDPVGSRILPNQPTDQSRAVWYNLGNYEYTMAIQFDVITDTKVVFTQLLLEVL